MSKRDAIRVIVGDGSRVDRDLVRFMLERDGFRVISSVAASEDLNRAASVMQPDAVVLGEELLDLGGGQAARLARGACPEAKIVLFSALPAAAAVGPGEPDAVLERGIGLKDLTRSLNDLFQPVAAGKVATLPLAAARARTSSAPAPTSPPPPPLTDEPRRRPVLVLAAAAAAIVLLAFVVARNFPPDESSLRSSAVPTPTLAPAIGAAGAATSSGGTATASPTATATGESPLSGVMAAIGTLKEAILEGNVNQVPSLVGKLAAQRAAAVAAGIDVSRLNALIGDKLAPLTRDMDPRVGFALRTLGTFVPPPDESNQGPSQPGTPNEEQPQPEPTTSPPPAVETGGTETPPTDTGGTDTGGTGGTDTGGGTDGDVDGGDGGPDAGETTQPGGEDNDGSVTGDQADDVDPHATDAAGNPVGSDAPGTHGEPAGGGDQPDSNQPIASTEPTPSPSGGRETTTDDDAPVAGDADADASADGS